MPFINIMVNTEVTQEKQLAVKTKLGKAISVFPGKSESYLMINIKPECNLYFGGKSDTPICKIMKEELNIPQDKTYVTYQEIENWGYNGFNF